MSGLRFRGLGCKFRVRSLGSRVSGFRVSGLWV